MAEYKSLNAPDANNSKKSERYQHTRFSLACMNGNLIQVTALIESDKDPNEMTPDGLLPIHFCCMRSQGLAILQYLLEQSRFHVDVNAGTLDKGKTPLMFAASNGLYKTAELLLAKKAEVNKQDKKGHSALFYAVKKGHRGMIKRLVSYNAFVNLRDNDNATVLHHLIRSFLKIEPKAFWQILHYLVEEKGMDIHTKMENGCTALHMACNFGFQEVIQYLIKKGGNLEGKMVSWETPIWTHVKSKTPSKDIIMMLFNNGANFQVKAPIGLSLLDYASKCLGNEELVMVLCDIQRIMMRRRMEVMRARRKSILSNGGWTSPIINFNSPPQSPQAILGQSDYVVSPEPQRFKSTDDKTVSNGNLSTSDEDNKNNDSSSDSTESSSTEDDDDDDSGSASNSSVSSDGSSDENTEDEEDKEIKASTGGNGKKMIITRQKTKQSEGKSKSGNTIFPHSMQNQPNEKEVEESLNSDDSDDEDGQVFGTHKMYSFKYGQRSTMQWSQNILPNLSDSDSDTEGNGLFSCRRQRNRKRAATTTVTDSQADRIKRKRNTSLATHRDSD